MTNVSTRWHLHNTHKLPLPPDPTIQSSTSSTVGLSPGARPSALSPFRDKAIYPQLLLSLPRLPSSPRLPRELAGVPHDEVTPVFRVVSPNPLYCLDPMLCGYFATNAASAAGDRAVVYVPVSSLPSPLLPALSATASRFATGCAERVRGYACAGCCRRSCWFPNTSRSDDFQGFRKGSHCVYRYCNSGQGAYLYSRTVFVCSQHLVGPETAPCMFGVLTVFFLTASTLLCVSQHIYHILLFCSTDSSTLN